MAKLRDYLGQVQSICTDLEHLGTEYHEAKQAYEQLYADPSQVSVDVAAQLLVGGTAVPIPLPDLTTLEAPLFDHVHEVALTITALWRKLADVAAAAVAHITTVEQAAQVTEPAAAPAAPLQSTLPPNLPPAATGWDGAATTPIGS